MNHAHRQNQRQRWMLYGGNVVLVSLLVLLTVVGVSILADWKNLRVDTTQAGLANLKPQTLKIIRDNKIPIKIVALIPEMEWSQDVKIEDRFDYRQPIFDLLDEYAAKGKNITFERIDPKKDLAKADQLIDEVSKRFGGEIEAYDKVINAYRGKPAEKDKPAEVGDAAKMDAMVKDEMNRFSQVILNVPSDNIRKYLGKIEGSFLEVASDLQKSLDDVKKLMDSKPPEYASAVRVIRENAETLSAISEEVILTLKAIASEPNIPPVLEQYAKDSPARYEEIKKFAAEVADRVANLSDLKIEEVRRNLRAKDVVLIMGDKEMKTVELEKIWIKPKDARGLVNGKLRPRFIGEQQITSAIVSLTNKDRQTIVFVHAGGTPLTTPDFPPFIQGGPFNIMASRLRELNFQVVEKDLAAPMNPNQLVQEATDEQLKNGLWIVVSRATGRAGGANPILGEKLKEHLDAGGSAMVMSSEQADDFAVALADFGLKIDSSAIVVHKLVETELESKDDLEEIQKQPLVFVLKNYGDHPIVKPLSSLNGILIPVLSVNLEKKPGVVAESIIPIPTSIETWGEKDIEGIRNREIPAKDEADLKPPFFGGAVAEKGDSRLVVFGSFNFAADGLVDYPDPLLKEQNKIIVDWFPANNNLFMNSIYWLTRQEDWIAVSASAMEINRVKAISPGMLNFWRYAVLLIGMPLLVVVAGVLMYLKRRD